jgi:hypothetical protein
MRKLIVCLGLVFASTLAGSVEAGAVRFTYSGTVTEVEDSGSLNIPIAVGDKVTYFITAVDAAAATNTGAPPSYYQWIEEGPDDASLWMNVGGTQISGTYQKAPGDAPFERLDVYPSGRVRTFMGTDSFDNITNNHGIAWSGNPDVKINQVNIEATWVGLAFVTPGPVPANPSSYLSSNFGTYSMEAGSLIHAKVTYGDSTTVFFNPDTLTIGAEPAVVPEPSTWALMGVGALAVGFVARRRKGTNG